LVNLVRWFRTEPVELANSVWTDT